MKVIFFQNLIAPYRVALFNELQKELRDGDFANEFEFEVYFMRSSETGRKWDIEMDKLNFPYILGRSLYKKIKSYHFHFNPSLLAKAVKSKNDLILGASWNNFNVVLLVALKKLGLIKNTLHIWTEANYQTFGAKTENSLRDKLRSFVYGGIDGTFIIPGQMALITLQKWGFGEQHFIYFPNLINTNLFNINLIESEAQPIKNVKPIFFIAARFEERRKGILNFLSILGTEGLDKISLKIAGDGDDKQLYFDYVKENNLNHCVEFLGNLTSEEVRKHLTSADVFVLPSFSDASPLAAVEAIYMKKPLLISDKCGNHFEVLRDNENGKLFNPFNPQSLLESFDFMLENKDRYQEMGNLSLEIGTENFNHKKVLNNFIKELLWFRINGNGKSFRYIS